MWTFRLEDQVGRWLTDTRLNAPSGKQGDRRARPPHRGGRQGAGGWPVQGSSLPVLYRVARVFLHTGNSAKIVG
jgi:hypothetical protein